MLPHFGEVAEPGEHVARTRERLHEWGELGALGIGEEAFVAHAESQLQAEGKATADLYRQLPGFDLSYAGLERYFVKRAERERGS